MENRIELKKAFEIGIVCIFSYLASYYMRNLLSVSTPGMLETGLYQKEFLGSLSSVYFLVYAFGQLINGTIGDRVRAKTMVLTGLVSCGAASVLFAFTETKIVQLLIFAVMGFALSMLRGPLVKTISENTLPKYARVCCVFFSFSSFAGPLIASLLAMFFDWRMTFIVAGASTIVIGTCAYIVLAVLEKKKIIKTTVKAKNTERKNVLEIFKLDKFVFYMFIGALVEISSASISFWIPTYLTERLRFDMDAANMIYSLMSFIRSFIPFVALVIFKWFKENDIKMIKCAFGLSAVLFATMLFISNKYVNVLFFLLALMAVGCASSLLWSIYIPSQGKSGLVSSINGVLDFTGYVAASAANMFFSLAMGHIGWNGIIVIWMLLMVLGVAAAFFQKNPAKTPLSQNAD